MYDDGVVLALGDDRNDQIGGQAKKAYLKPEKISVCKEGKVIQAVCGQYYTAYLVDDGHVVICGWRNGGKPLDVKFDDKIVYINAGFDAPCAIDEHGCVYVFDSDYTKEPKKYELSEKVYDIARGQDLILALTVDGVVYGKKSEEEKFSKVKSLENYKVKRVYASYGIAGALTQDNKVLLRAKEGFELVEGLKDVKIVQMDLGKLFSIFITEDGVLYGCGQNTHGQLLIGRTDDKPVPITMGPFTSRTKISYVKCGAHHSFAIVNGNQLPHLGAIAFNIQ